MASIPDLTSVVVPPPDARAFYLDALGVMQRSGIRYLVGGGFALACHSGIVRHTKDLDLFILAHDRDRALAAFADAGYRTEITWPHFLAKALHEDHFVDLIYSSANGACPVDEQWFANAATGEVLGVPVNLCPAEEMIWQKLFIMDRDRFDGADVNHLLLARGHSLDWQRLIERVEGGNERVLLAHLLLFEFVYPSQRNCIPEWVVTRLIELGARDPLSGQQVCRGTLLSKDQYAADLARGCADPRIEPRGPLTQTDVDGLVAA